MPSPRVERGAKTGMETSSKSEAAPKPWKQPVRSDSPPGFPIFLSLVAFRIVNALAVQTFFQPDEYFQALEPGWRVAFGSGGSQIAGGSVDGPWITWVCSPSRAAVARCETACVHDDGCHCAFLLELRPP